MRFLGWNIDFIGFSASFACAVHCMALPLVLSLGMFGGTDWLENEALEVMLVLSSIILASYSIGKSYFKSHGQIVPVIWLVAGILLLLISLSAHHYWHHGLMALGGFAIAIAHYVNWRLLSCKIPIPVSRQA